MTDQYVRAARPVPRSAARTGRVHRLPSVRRYAMTRPSFFAVDYAINPWMDVTTLVDAGRAQAQWEALRRTYLRLGHRVDVIEPVAGLPDMVYAANGGFIAGDVAIVARFRFAQRAGESRAYAEWMRSLGYRPLLTRHVNEGQGDLLKVGDIVLAGWGFAPTAGRIRRFRRRCARRSCRWNWSTRASTISTPRWRCSTTARSRSTRPRSATRPGGNWVRCSRMPSWSARPTRTCWALTSSPTGYMW